MASNTLRSLARNVFLARSGLGATKASRTGKEDRVALIELKNVILLLSIVFFLLQLSGLVLGKSSPLARNPPRLPSLKWSSDVSDLLNKKLDGSCFGRTQKNPNLNLIRHLIWRLLISVLATVRKFDIQQRRDLTEFGQYVAECQPKFVQKVQLTAGDELEILIAPEGVVPVLTFLKDHHNAQFTSLADIAGADYPTREFRFEVLKHIKHL